MCERVCVLKFLCVKGCVCKRVCVKQRLYVKGPVCKSVSVQVSVCNRSVCKSMFV